MISGAATMVTGFAATSTLLDVSSMNTFDLSYADHGTSSHEDLATYTPDDFCKTSPRAWFTVGDWAPGGYSTPQGHVLVVRAPASDPDALVRPVGMTMNWTNKKGSGTHGARQGGLFSPICPTGYGYLGSVGVYHDGILDPSVVTPDTFPSLMCVSETYLRANDAAHQPALKQVWTDQGSGCDYSGSVWAQPDLARPDGSLISLPFVAGAYDSYDAPAVPYSLDTSKVAFQPPLARCSPPEQVHIAFGLHYSVMGVQWATMSDVQTSPTVQYGRSPDALTMAATGRSFVFTQDAGRTWYNHVASGSPIKLNP
jgi:hypothetical protein